MKHLWYVFTKDQPIVEFNEKRFEDAVALTGNKWYEYIQTFNGNDIVSYNTIVIEWVESDRLDIVRALYGVYPWQIRVRDEITHAVFRFIRPLSKKNVTTIAEQFATLLGWDYLFHTFFKQTCTYIAEEEVYTDPMLIQQYFNDKYCSDTINHSTEQYINDTVDIREISLKLPSDNLICDSFLNVAIGYGKPFYTVFKCLWFSLSAAYRFFNTHFNAGFKTDDKALVWYLNSGIIVKTAELVEHDGWLSLLTDNWYKWVTDFIIKVHYQLNRPEWEVGYIVTLTNKFWEQTDYIEWKNSANESEMIRYIQSFGNYHLNANKVNLKILHTAIATTEVPVITGFSEYGINTYKWERILILPDGIMNTNSKRFFMKDADDKYLTFGWNDAISVVGATENVDSHTMCRFSTMQEHKYEDFMGISKSIYSDLSGDIIPMMACSMAGYMAYESYIKEAPLYFVTWVSGSGKSTFAELLGSMFGVSSFLKLSSTTILPLKYLLSSGRRLPVFLSEYRASMDYKAQKDSLIRETFDNGEIQRGQRDGKVSKYRLSAQMFIEGEDIYTSGSIRTRTIIHRTSTAWRTDCKPQDIIKKNKELASSFLYSYLVWTKKEDYDKYITEWYEIFKHMWAEPRVVSNIQIMYAWCMAFAPHLKDYFIEKLKLVMKVQVQDFEQNSVTKQFLKVMGQYMGWRFARYYTDLWYVYINWNDIIEYCEKNRKQLDNSLDSYRNQLVELWFESDFFEVENKDDFNRTGKVIIDWVRIKIENTPKEFLVNGDLYREYISVIQKKWA